jgi:hypothetical protein
MKLHPGEEIGEAFNSAQHEGYYAIDATTNMKQTEADIIAMSLNNEE